MVCQPPRKSFPSLYAQVLIAIALGVAIGFFAPEFATTLKPLGDGFIKLIKMLIAPIIFCTVVTGIGGVESLKKVGRVGLKAIFYFEVLTTVALVIGMSVIHIFQPGAGMNVDASLLDTAGLTAYTSEAKHVGVVDFILNIIPQDFVGAFTHGEVLQVLLIAILFGLALSSVGDAAKPVLRGVEQLSAVFFKIVNMLMRLAPIGAFGAMAFTVGKYGILSLAPLAKLMACFYLTCALFVLVILGGVARGVGFNIFKFLKYIKEEIFIVLSTSSSESALPLLMKKLENLGCKKAIVGMVVPAGYSFNLDGTSIYLTMAALFVAQATGTHLSFGQELTILGILLLSSKGAAGVTGSGFITLAATLSAVPAIPVSGLALILGIDRFMSEARAITNIIGNGVATLTVARWENELDLKVMKEVLNRENLGPNSF
jgi:aerobic C4-dicarboxylate transport protein